jgi:hypothetical protein
VFAVDLGSGLIAGGKTEVGCIKMIGSRFSDDDSRVNKAMKTTRRFLEMERS